MPFSRTGWPFTRTWLPIGFLSAVSAKSAGQVYQQDPASAGFTHCAGALSSARLAARSASAAIPELLFPSNSIQRIFFAMVVSPPKPPQDKFGVRTEVISWSRTVGPPPTGRRTPLRKPLGLIRLEQALGQDESQPVQIVQTSCGSTRNRSETNCSFQYQLATPTCSGNSCTAALKSACWSRIF